MDSDDVAAVVAEVTTLVNEHYVDPAAAVQITRALAASLAGGRYASDEQSLAAAVTADLQSVNGDKHLRLVYHAAPLPASEPGDDAAEYAAMASWADRTGHGIARVEWLTGNIGYLDVQPVLFPPVISGDAVTAAMSLIAPADALILDLRNCLGGDPGAAVFLCSYLHGPEPVELTGLYEREHDRVRQQWTLPFVPGRRFGPAKPVYVLTGSATFSGGEQVAYDLQQLGRATIIGQRTKGGAHAREGFRVHPHLEATISVARAVSPVTGGNWEGSGVTPDIRTSPGEEKDRAHQLALDHVAAAPGATAAEAG